MSRDRILLSPASRRRVFALCGKEFRQMTRDPSSILIACALPLVLLFLFGYGLSLDSDHIRIGIALEDDGAPARRLCESFQATSYFSTRIGRTRQQLEHDLVAGEIRGLVVIPSTFCADWQTPGRTPCIQVLSDGSEPNTAVFVENYARSVVALWARAQAREQGQTAALAALPAIETRVWFNPELHSRFFLLPGCLTLILAITGTLLTALVVAREWERGTMESLLSTPVSPAEILLSKLLPYFALGLGSLVLATAAACVGFGLPLRGSVLVLGMSASAFLLASLALGLFISTAAKNQFVAAQAALLLAFLPATMLSGFIFEIEAMPVFLQVVTKFVPASYFVPALQTVCLAGNVWAAILPGTAVLLLMSAVLLGATLRKSSRRLA